MPRSIAERALSLAFAEGVPVAISFFGGEPLLEKVMLFELARSARAMADAAGVRLAQQVTTNGTLLDDASLHALEALDVAVTLSLDGGAAAQDAGRRRLGGQSSFPAVVRAAERLARSTRGLDVVAVVTPANVRELPGSVRFLLGLGARRISLNPAFDAAWGDADLAAWESALDALTEIWTDLRRRGAEVALPVFDDPVLASVKGGRQTRDRCDGRRHWAVAPSGRIYPCDRLVRDDRDPRLAVGHVDGGLPSSRPRHAPVDVACASCPERIRCGAHCGCANFAETGELDLPGPVQCWYERTRARLADAAALSLLDARCEPFVSWAYGARPHRRLRVVAERAGAAS